MKTIVRLNLLMAFVAVVGTGIAQADPVSVSWQNDVLEAVPGGTINWTARRIEAKGAAEKDQSAFQQQLAAEVQARANLLKVLDGVRIKAERVTRDGRIKGEMLSESIEGILRHSRVSPPTVNALGLTEVAAYAYLDNDGTPMLMPDLAAPKGTETAPSIAASQTDSDNWTGLVIDAGSMPIRPALVPRIILEGGDTVLNEHISMSHTDILRKGYCGYTGSEEKARQNTDRIGLNPLVLEATGVSSNGVDLFISNEDAARVRELDDKNGVLKTGRIIIVVGDRRR